MNCTFRFLRAKHLLEAIAVSLLVLFSPALSHAQITPSGNFYINIADANYYVLRTMLGYFVAIELALALLVALACASVLALIGIYISSQRPKSEQRQTHDQNRSGLSLQRGVYRNCAPRTSAKQSLGTTAVFVLLVLCWSSLSFGQITPSADSYTNTADSTTNYGSKTLLDVDAATQITYIQFPLSSIPSGASVSQATLKLYVNSVPTAGSFNVDYVSSAWSESTIDSSNAPPLGTNIASNVNVTTASRNQYILINVTNAVQAWLSGSETNNGIALVANSTFNATFDSKENTTTSHPPELDIAYASADGTITGVTTASGSGLTGGGTSGTLNLGLTNACAANQVLQWSGTAWACSSVGAGTITGVTAGADLTGGGTSGAVTLNLDTTKVPLLAAANTFTGDNTFSVSATDAIDAYTTGPGKSAVVAMNSATGGGSYGVYATTEDSTGAGVFGFNGGSSGTPIGILGLSNSGIGMEGIGSTGVTASGVNYGVYATASAANTVGVYGAGGVNGVFGVTSQGTGVAGNVTVGSGVGGWSTNGNGVFGTVSSSGYGVYGTVTSSGYGVYGSVPSSGFDAVHGETYSDWAGVAGVNHSTGGYGVYGLAQGIEGYAGGFFNSANGWAGYFQGNVDVVGSLSKSGGSFKIDHPLDPENKYLYHSFVESPDMKNIYDGVAPLDANGEAIIEMPDWFGILNRDFRYQLTCIGGFAPVYVAEELANNQFKIGGGRAGMRVSWQITGIRQDPWANAHRIPVEQEKEDKLKGFYLHPELYGAPAEKQIEWARHPLMMKKVQQDGEQMKQEQVPLVSPKTER